MVPACQKPPDMPRVIDKVTPAITESLPQQKNSQDQSTSVPQAVPSPTKLNIHNEENSFHWLEFISIPFTTVDPRADCSELIPFLDMVGEARVVALGEATHGSSEFFSMKHLVTKCLVEEKGFNLFAIEANLPESALINDYVLEGSGDPAVLLSGLYFWTWNTQEVLDMINWMREHNLNNPHSTIEFHGFDMQHSVLAIDNVLAYLDRTDEEYAEEARELMGCFLSTYPTPGEDESYFQNPWTDYETLSFTTRKSCRNKLTKVFDYLEGNKAALINDSSQEEYQYILRNARVILQAEDFVYSYSSPKRDRYMAENVSWILDQSGPDSKIILWAHNLHVQDELDVMMGKHLRDRFQEDLVVVGFSFFEGKFNAYRASSLQAQDVKPHLGPIEFTSPEKESFEYYLHQAGIPRFYIDLRDPRIEMNQLDEELPFYGIVGAVYDPSSPSFIVKSIPELFDLMIYIEESTPSELLPLLPVYNGKVIQ